MIRNRTVIPGDHRDLVILGVGFHHASPAAAPIAYAAAESGVRRLRLRDYEPLEVVIVAPELIEPHLRVQFFPLDVLDIAVLQRGLFPSRPGPAARG